MHFFPAMQQVQPKFERNTNSTQKTHTTPNLCFSHFCTPNVQKNIFSCHDTTNLEKWFVWQKHFENLQKNAVHAVHNKKDAKKCLKQADVSFKIDAAKNANLKALSKTLKTILQKLECVNRRQPKLELVPIEHWKCDKLRSLDSMWGAMATDRDHLKVHFTTCGVQQRQTGP